MAPAILALAQLAPTILGLFTKDETATKAAQAVSTVARAVTGQEDDEKALRALQANPQLVVEYQKAMNAQAVAMYQEETKRLEAVNRTIQAEAASCDPFVRRWRPTFGYCVAATWSWQMGALGVAIVKDPTQAPQIIAAMASLSAIWSVALAVLGVAVHQRSKDKQVASGQTPAGMIAGLFGKK